MGVGRKRLPDSERREKITLRLPKATIERIQEQGIITEVIEMAIEEYLRTKEKENIRLT